MKISIFLLALLQLFSVRADEITGSWHGQLDIQGVKLNLLFHINKQDEVFTSTMDSPDQGAIGIATTKTTFTDNKLKITIAKIGGQFKGTLTNNQLIGHFSQSGMRLPLTLIKAPESIKSDGVEGADALMKPDITGSWYGELEVPGNALKIVFHIDKNKEGYSTKMDSPNQNVMGKKTTSTVFKNNRLKVIIEKIDAEYNAVLEGDQLIGTFQQRGGIIPLKLNKNSNQSTSNIIRPQDPNTPLPYESKEVHFINNEAGDITLAGTLTLPKHSNKPPVAILITGSGPQNRNEELFNHRPFLVWSDYLTRHGIAVLRYDDRGVAESEGTRNEATSKDYASDVEAAVHYLQSRTDVDVNKIGLVGHSEGGFIATMVAANNKNIAFVVSLAGPGVIGSEVLYTQSEQASKLAGMDKKTIEINQQIMSKTHQIMKTNHHNKKLEELLENYLKSMRNKVPETLAVGLTDDRIAAQVETLASPWYQYFLNTDPDQFLSQVTCPTLAINGSLDFQVIADLNLNGIKRSLVKAGNKDVTIKKLDGLNHLFQTAKTGYITEYGTIEETVAPKALKLVTGWINQRFGSDG